MFNFNAASLSTFYCMDSAFGVMSMNLLSKLERFFSCFCPEILQFYVLYLDP